MNTFRLFINSILLGMTPSLLVYPQTIEAGKVYTIPSLRFSNPIDALFEKVFSDEELKKACFSLFIQGNFLPFSLEMVHPSIALGPLSFHTPLGYLFSHPLVQKKCRETQAFVQAYQKEILIGLLVVVVVIVVVAVIVASYGSLTAAAAGAAALSSAALPANLDSRNKENDFASLIKTTSKILEGEQSPCLKSALEEEISSLKENLSQVIDKFFSTEYAPFFAHPHQESDLSFLSHYLYGQTSLELGRYEEASIFLEKAIAHSPTQPLPYLERASLHLQLGEYERLLEDFATYTSYKEEDYSFSLFEFTKGFAKELPQGIYDCGEGFCHFAKDLVSHPIHTGQEMWQALHTLSDLARSKEWETLGEALVPEIYELATQWDTLSSTEKGKLAGYAFGKYGSDILIPGTLAKASSKGAKGIKRLHAARKQLQTAEKTLLFESIAAAENPSQTLAELKEMGSIESALSQKSKYLFEDPSLQKSFELFKKAETSLKPYSKEYLAETQAKELIHQTGIRTFPRPAGIPENYKVQLSDKGAGIKYVDPNNSGNSVRVMPGKPHSPLPCQQKPYIIQLKDGDAFDKFGNLVPPKSPQAHIPLQEFTYRE